MQILTGEPMKNLLISALLTTSVTAQADIINCSFTEPFFSLQYSTTTNELARTEYDFDKDKMVTKTTKNVSFQIKGPAKFQLLAVDKTPIMNLELNFKGSDGMSDRVYPYDAELLTDGNSMWGGCDSNFLKATLDSAN
jgi:uncharacterized membrane protein